MNILKSNTGKKIFRVIFRSKYTSLLIGLIFVVITIALWKTSEEDSLEKLSKNMDSITEVYASKIEGRIDNIEFSLDELASRGVPSTVKEESEWDMRTDFYTENLGGIANIVWVDSDLIIRRVSPKENSEYIINTKITNEHNLPNYTNIVLPIYHENAIVGFIIGNIDVPVLILSIEFEQFNDYMIQVFDGNQLLASSSDWEQSKADVSVRKDITFNNKIFSFVVTPTNEAVNQSMFTSRFIMIFGLFLSGLMTLIWYSRTVSNIRLQGLVADKTLELSYLSYHDQLTGLYNRRFFEEEMNRLDNPRNLPLSIIMGDVNGLKLINDAFGHKAGDQLLQMIGDTISASTRGNDIAARWGGDEFTILLPNTTADNADILISRIQEKIKKVFFEYGKISISFGVDCKHSEEEDIRKIFTNAEELMYQNKLVELDSIRGETINTIMTTLFEKSAEIKEHSVRVSNLSVMIAEEMGLSKTNINDIKTMGMIHDIGKIVIDLHILDKPGKLTKEEREIIQQHPLSGSKMLNSSHEYTRLAVGVLHHHERIDGTGYPNGILGDQIPLESKIIAVADAFDAMTAQRPYRLNPLSFKEAIDELKKHSGTQFDIKIVDVFVNKVIVKYESSIG